MISQKDSAFFLVLLVLSVAIFRKFTIQLNVITGITIASLIIYYIYIKAENEKIEFVNQIKTKDKLIRPSINKIENYPNIVDFLFSIGEFYSFSPANYETMVDSIDEFLTLYEESNKINNTAGNNYTIAQIKKSSSLNSLQAFIFSIPPSVKMNFVNKMDRATDNLNFILSGMLYDIYIINKRYIEKNGFNIDSINLDMIIDNKFKPVNYYENNNVLY